MKKYWIILICFLSVLIMLKGVHADAVTLACPPLRYCTPDYTWAIDTPGGGDCNFWFSDTCEGNWDSWGRYGEGGGFQLWFSRGQFWSKYSRTMLMCGSQAGFGPFPETFCGYYGRRVCNREDKISNGCWVQYHCSDTTKLKSNGWGSETATIPISGKVYYHGDGVDTGLTVAAAVEKVLQRDWCEDSCINDATGTDYGTCYTYTTDTHGCTFADDNTDGRNGGCTEDYKCNGVGACVRKTCDGVVVGSATIKQVIVDDCHNKTQTCLIDGWTNTTDTKYVTVGASCSGGTGICNASGSCVGLALDTYWTDMIGKPGNPITDADKGDTVLLVAEATVNNQIINFIINSTCGNIQKSAIVTNGKAIANWTTNNCSKGNTIYEWTFNASYNIRPSVSAISDGLTVSKTVDSSPPVAIILSPSEGQVFNNGTTVYFNQSSYDVDDFINWTWDFGDGTTNVTGKYYPMNLTNYNTTHKYETGGQKIVTLTVNSMGRSGKTVARIKIMINESGVNYLPLAIISSPENNEELPVGPIRFNASMSIDDITPKENLNFTWRFEINGVPITKTGSEGAIIEHDYTGKVPKSYTVTLRVDDGFGNSSYTSIIIRLTGTTKKCEGTDVPFGECGYSKRLTPKEVWCSTLGIIMNNCTKCNFCDNDKICDTISGNCTKPDCYNKEYSDCKKGVGCFWNGTICQDCLDIKKSINVYCSFYGRNSTDCSADKCNMGLDSGGTCSFNGKCDLQKLSNINTPRCDGVKCTQRVDCSNNKYLISCDTDSQGKLDCCDSCQLTKLELDERPCGGAAGISAVMPFFGWMQFTAAALIIALFYFLRNKLKNKNK